jgi:hypothetical protein
LLQLPPSAVSWRQVPPMQDRLPLQLVPQQGWLAAPQGTQAPPISTVPAPQLPPQSAPLHW